MTLRGLHVCCGACVQAIDNVVKGVAGVETVMTTIETELVRNWVEQAVLGLGLCPFASEHWHAGRVRLAVTTAATEQVLLTDLHAEITTLDMTDSKLLETTLLIVPNLLLDFAEYNRFLDLADELIEQHDWAGRFQIASFHPGYQFAGTKPDDLENLTNRSPYPLLHVLREGSVSRAVSEHPDPDQIVSTNIATLRGLSEERRQEIFGHPPVSRSTSRELTRG